MLALVNIPGTQEVMDGALDSKIIKNYVDIPGFDDGGPEYLLYCPGTSIEEIGEEIISLFPEHYKEENIVNGVFNKYLLMETDGNHYVWRDSSY